MDEIVCFTILGEKKEYKKGTKFADIAKEYQKEYKDRGYCREKGLQEKRDSYDAESSASHFGK